MGLTPVPGAGRVGGPIPEGMSPIPEGMMSGGGKPAAGGIARGENRRPKGDAGSRPPARAALRGEREEARSWELRFGVRAARAQAARRVLPRGLLLRSLLHVPAGPGRVSSEFLTDPGARISVLNTNS